MVVEANGRIRQPRRGQRAVEVELMAQRLEPLARAVDDGEELEAAELFERIRRLLEA